MKPKTRMRWKLSLGLLAQLCILLLVAGYSIWLLNKNADTIPRLLDNNYRSIRLGTDISELSRKVFLLHLIAKDDTSGQFRESASLQMTAYEQEKSQLFEKIKSNISHPKENDLIQKLEQKVTTLFTLTENVITSRADPSDQHTLLISILREIDKQVAIIREVNEEQIIASRNAIMNDRQDTIWFFVFIVFISLGIAIVASIRIGQSVLVPIESLTLSLAEIEKGNYEQSLKIKSHDEMFDMAQAFNSMQQELLRYRQQTEEKIHDLNSLVTATISAFPYPIFLLDSLNNIHTTNKAADHLMEKLGTIGEIPPRVQKLVDEHQRSGDLSWDNEIETSELDKAMLFRIDENEFHYLPRIFDVGKSSNQQKGRAVVLVDVSRFRWLDDMKTNMISNVSHEIKTPLTGIRMILHLLQEDDCGTLNQTQRELVESACEDCERLLKTLNSFLELSRIEAGTAQLDLQPVQSQTIISDAIEFHRDSAGKKSVEFKSKVGTGAEKVMADPSRISHVINNLINNAIKYAPSGSYIDVTAHKQGSDKIRFRVIDRGPGIAEEERSKVFDKFYRSSGQAVKGVGLGLSISRQIIEGHRGNIGVTQNSNQENEFYFDLFAA